MCESQELVVRNATADDVEGILDISKDVYDGLDYLPFAIEDWIQESEQEGSRRKNIIFSLREHVKKNLHNLRKRPLRKEGVFYIKRSWTFCMKKCLQKS